MIEPSLFNVYILENLYKHFRIIIVLFNFFYFSLHVFYLLCQQQEEAPGQIRELLFEKSTNFKDWFKV